MLVIPTAKALLFIALNLGPQNPATVFATSNSESYVWKQTKLGWDVEALAFPSSDCTRNDSIEMAFNGDPTTDGVPSYLRELTHYDWSHNNAIVFDNGDRIEKYRDHAFWIINAGGANEKVFTILYPTKDDPKIRVKRAPDLVKTSPM